MERTTCVGILAALVGYGRSAMAVTMPVLSAMGYQPCAMPTAVMSTHPGGFTGYAMQDMTAQLGAQMWHYAQEGISLDALITGFLYSPAQQGLCRDFIRAQRKTGMRLVLIDPVMGDGGKPYRITTPEMMDGMRHLVSEADIITPNLWEACVLTGMEYRPVFPEAETDELLTHLRTLGAGSVVVTSCVTERGAYNLYADKDGRGRVSYEPLPQGYPGTGDLFASVLLGKLLQKRSLAESVAAAAEFVSCAVKRTIAAGTPIREGTLFEPLLKNL